MVCTGYVLMSPRWGLFAGVSKYFVLTSLLMAVISYVLNAVVAVSVPFLIPNLAAAISVSILYACTFLIQSLCLAVLLACFLLGPPTYKRKPNPEACGFHVDWIQMKSGRIGMSIAPGRKDGNPSEDLASIPEGSLVINLLEDQEMQLMGFGPHGEAETQAAFAQGLDLIRLPARDKWTSIPLLEMYRLCCPEGKIDQVLASGHDVVIHCFGGKGRTATVVCAYLIASQNKTVSESIAIVKQTRPGTIKNPLQQLYLHIFSRSVPSLASQLENSLT